jgi:hypothetical protein
VRPFACDSPDPKVCLDIYQRRNTMVRIPVPGTDNKARQLPFEHTTATHLLRAVGGGKHPRLPGNVEAFITYIEQCLVPTLRRGDIVVADNVSFHNVAGVEEVIEARRAELRLLPELLARPQPIELVLRPGKALRRKAAERTVNGLERCVKLSECAGYFRHCGDDPSLRQMPMSRIDHAKGSEAESWFGLEQCVFGYVRGGAPVPALTGVMLYSSTEIIERSHNGTAVLRADGSIYYSAKPGFTGRDYLRVQRAACNYSGTWQADTFHDLVRPPRSNLLDFR